MFNKEITKATGKVHVVVRDENQNIKEDFLVDNLVVNSGLDFIADGDENYFYSDKLAGLENKERMYMLNRKTGSFMVGLGEYGFCVEKGFRWKLNKIRSQYEYTRN